VGDSVQVNTLFGWANAKVLAIKGIPITPTQRPARTSGRIIPTRCADSAAPTRKITPTACTSSTTGCRLASRASGWIARSSRSSVATTRSRSREIASYGRHAAASLHRVSSEGSRRPAGTAPKPGLTGCNGKFDGRYSSGGFGNFNTKKSNAGPQAARSTCTRPARRTTWSLTSTTTGRSIAPWANSRRKGNRAVPLSQPFASTCSRHPGKMLPALVFRPPK